MVLIFKRGIDSENDSNDRQFSLSERPLHDNSNVNKVSNTLSELNQTEPVNRERNQTASVCNSCFKVKETNKETELKSTNNKKSKSDETDESKTNTIYFLKFIFHFSIIFFKINFYFF